MKKREMIPFQVFESQIDEIADMARQELKNPVMIAVLVFVVLFIVIESATKTLIRRKRTEKK